MLYNIADVKKSAKNLKIELSKLGLELSHGAALNLVARTLGFADYNTLVPHMQDFEVELKKVESKLTNIEQKIDLTSDKTPQVERLLIVSSIH